MDGKELKMWSIREIKTSTPKDWREKQHKWFEQIRGNVGGLGFNGVIKSENLLVELNVWKVYSLLIDVNFQVFFFLHFKSSSSELACSAAAWPDIRRQRVCECYCDDRIISCIIQFIDSIRSEVVSSSPIDFQSLLFCNPSSPAGGGVAPTQRSAPAKKKRSSLPLAPGG